MTQDAPVEHRGLTRMVVRWFVHFYYPRIEIVDADHIPQTGPVLLCANHGNSLVDPVIIGIVARRPVRFMAKAPLFRHPIIGPPMTALGMIPAYRGSDDAKDVRRNLESLDVAAKVLIEDHTMGIFPEGKSTDQAHLEMIRSGAARMALQAVNAGAKDLLVVPIGITYERKDQFRSSVLVRVAVPINVQQLLDENDSNEKKTRRAFTNTLEERLRNVVVHLDEPQWESWLEFLEILAPSESPSSVRSDSPLWRRKWIADAINHYLATDRDSAVSVAQDIESHAREIRQIGLSFDSPLLQQGRLATAVKLLGQALWLVLFLVPALLGTIHHILPFVVVRAIASRMDQPGRKTIATHRLLVGVPVYLLWYGLVTAGLLFLSAPVAWCWLALAPVAGVIAHFYWQHARDTFLLLIHHLRALLAPSRLDELRRHRAMLRDRLNQLAADFATTQSS